MTNAAPIKLHLGCADQILSGWVNISLLTGEKEKHVTWRELAPVTVHSHANSFGDTPDLPLEFVLNRIEEFQKVISSGSSGSGKRSPA